MTFGGNDFMSTANQNDTNPTLPMDLAMLMERCRGDLIFMDSLLNDLEITFQQEIDEPTEQVVRIDCPETASASHAMKSKIGELGAESIRRMADDIENLCRTTMFDGVQEMLGNLQDEMVRGLRLLPTASRMRLN
jgi:hypothetical protein